MAKHFYFVDTREMDASEISDEQWIFIAKNNSIDNNYVLTEEEFEEHKDDVYLREMEWRKL